MASFDLYPQAWALYIVLGLVFLYLLDVKLRRYSFKTRVAVLSLIAVGAFTPEMVREAESYAPLILTSLFNAELDGVGTLYKGLTTLLILWGIVFALVLAIRHIIGATKEKKSISKSQTNESTALKD